MGVPSRLESNSLTTSGSIKLSQKNQMELEGGRMEYNRFQISTFEIIRLTEIKRQF